MTVDNVTQILNKIPGDKWEKVMVNVGLFGLAIPRPLVKQIQRRYSTDTDKNHAVADYYVNCHPKADWEHLTEGLYVDCQFASARESRTNFMSNGKHWL